MTMHLHYYCLLRVILKIARVIMYGLEKLSIYIRNYVGNYKNATLQGKGQPKQFSNKQKLYRKSSLLLARTAYISMVSASRVPSSVVTKQCKLFLISLLQAATIRRPFNSLPAQ